MESQHEVTTMIRRNINNMNSRMNLFNEEKKILKNLDLFVLDNSLRENVVGSMCAHTVENKYNIFNEVKRCGMKHVAVASFNHQTRTADQFLDHLKEKGEYMNDCFAFVELVEDLESERPPQGLSRCQELGIHNIVLQLDLNFKGIDYSQYNAQKICELLTERFRWIRQHLSQRSLILVNLRDFTECMARCPARVFYIVNYLSSLPDSERIFGLCYEDGGRSRCEELSVWTGCVREEMNKHQWRGHLLANIHGQYGQATTKLLQCLANGASGMWSGVAEESATCGHASTCLVVANLARMGNKKVLAQFNYERLLQASRTITNITTGAPPHPRTPVVGYRASGLAFGAREPRAVGDIVGERVPRISHRSLPSQIVERLVSVYGWRNRFNEEIALNMKMKMSQWAKVGKVIDFNSRYGLAVLFEKSGGHPIDDMKTCMELNTRHENRHAALINAVREQWEVWAESDVTGSRDSLGMTEFYNGFLSQYFGNSRNNQVWTLLEKIGLLKNGRVQWNDFSLHLRFAVGERGPLDKPEEVLSIAFTQSIIPYMEEMIVEESKDVNTFYKNYKYAADPFFGGYLYKYREWYPRWVPCKTAMTVITLLGSNEMR